MGKLIAAAFLVVSSYGCNLIGPSCLSLKHSGAVTTLNGEVAAGKMVSQRVRYGSEGSQNGLEIRWPGQFTVAGPKLRVYATKVDCVDFVPPGTGVCGDLGGFSGTISPNARPCAVNHTCNPEPGDIVQTSMIITNGHGNPERLGNPAEYMLWIVGDPEQNASYTINITWFYGPDC